MQTCTPFSTFRQSPRKLIDDDDFTIPDHILSIPNIVLVNKDGLLQLVVDIHHRRINQQLGLRKLPSFAAPGSVERDLFRLGIDFKMFFLHKLVADVGRPFVKLCFCQRDFVRQAADDQRRSGFVDQDTIGFIDQHEIQLALDRHQRIVENRAFHHFGDHAKVPHFHATSEKSISEKIKTDFFGRRVSHVAGVSFLAIGSRSVALNNADRHSQCLVNRLHQFGVTSGEVIIGRCQVGSLASQRCQEHRQRRG